jgi:hypothetical protein
MISHPERSAERDAAMDAVLPLVADKSWTRSAMREALANAGAVEDLFDLFDRFLKAKGYLAMGGQIVDATIVSAPRLMPDWRD